MDNPKIICVLGMHRSGTSLAARLLNILGMYLGPEEHLMKPTAANPGGYWENEPLTELNSEILARLEGNWHRPPRFRPGWEMAPELADLRRSARELVVHEFGDAPLWGWKDPRTCLTLPLWQRLLPPMKYVLCLRNPVDVARSLAARRAEPVPFNKALDLWVTYVRSSITASAGHDRLVLFYEDMMEDWQQELRRLGSFIDKSRRASHAATRQEVGRFVQEEFRHHRATVPDVVDDPSLPFPAKSLYFALRLWNRGGQHLDSSGSLRLIDLFTDYSVEADRQFRRLRTRTQQQDEALEEAERQRKELGSELDARSEELSAREAELRDVRGALEEMEGRRNRLRVDLEARSADLSAREAELGELRSALEETKRSEERHRVDLEARSADLSAREAELGELRSALEEQKRSEELLREELEARSAETSAESSELRELREVSAQGRRRVGRLRRELEEERRLRGELEAALKDRDQESGPPRGPAEDGPGGQGDPGRHKKDGGRRSRAGREGAKDDASAAPSQGGYAQLVQRIRAVAEEELPGGATALVASKGDRKLLKLKGIRGWHFPQTSEGAYAGHHPADSIAAIAHLEALRLKGADHLVFPSTSFWWLDHYEGLRRHLERSYEVLFDDRETCIIYRLAGVSGDDANPSIEAQLAEVVAEFWARFDRHPSVLDWDSGLSLPETLPDLAAFSPASNDSVLPYADQSVDIVVAAADGGPRSAEARRVASAALVSVAPRVGEEPGAGPSRGDRSVTIEWLAQWRKPPTMSASIIAVAERADGTGAIAGSVPTSLPVELILIGDAPGSDASIAAGNEGLDMSTTVVSRAESIGESVNRAVQRATGDILVFATSPVVPFPDWLEYLIQIFRTRPDAGAVGAKLVSTDGTLLEVGGLIAPDGSWEPVGAGEPLVDTPPYNHVRDVDACSPTLFATRRALFEHLRGFDVGYRTPLYAALDYSLRVRQDERRVYCQPAAVGVELGSRFDPSAEEAALDRARLLERHRSVILGSGPGAESETVLTSGGKGR